MVNIQPQYAYFGLSLTFLTVWLVLFIIGKHTRREQFWMSLLMSPLGTIGELFYFQDYWHPPTILSFSLGPIPILLEDFMFMFAIAGIGTVIYKIIFRKQTKLIEPPPKYQLGIISLLIISAAFPLTLWINTDLNSIFVTSLISLIFATSLVIQRRDLRPVSFYSGLLFTMIVAIVYGLYSILIIGELDDSFLKQFWFLYGSPLDIRLGKMPITELIWAFTTGAALGPLYAFATKKKIVSAD